MSAVLERCIAAKSRAQVAPVTPPHWRREIQGDAGRYDGAFRYALPGAAKTLEIAETAASTGTTGTSRPCSSPRPPSRRRRIWWSSRYARWLR